MPRYTTRNPLSFTYNLQTYDLKQYKRINSRESLGVWVIDNWAWKIFSEENQWDRVDYEYNRVKSHALQLLDPHTFWTRVTVHYDNKTRSQGFAIVSPFIDVRGTSFYPFDLKKGTGSLESVIKKKIHNTSALQRIYQAFQAAEQLGLADPQGFVDTDPNNENPVMFIDIHLYTVASGRIIKMRQFLAKQIGNK